MSWLTPLGFLGFIGLLALILIYILKPNYQQKMISSTFIWKLSLKYKKKKLPISKLRNVLLFICQVLAITSIALLLARPIIAANRVVFTDKVFIIDGSGNMLAGLDGQTRFERAVEQVKSSASTTFSTGGNVTVIFAGEQAEVVLGTRLTSDRKEELFDELDSFVVPGDLKCTYGSADITGAVTLSEDVLRINENTDILLYTASEYIDKGDITVKNVGEDDEWNAAILDCYVEVVDNFYNFVVETACYGARYSDQEVNLVCQISKVNGSSDQTFIIPVRFAGEEKQKIVFNRENHEAVNGSNSKLQDVYSYSSARIYFDFVEKDSFSYDDEYYLYGGDVPTVKVTYYSPFENSFMPTVLMNIANRWRSSLKVDINEEYGLSPDKYASEGYDFYIYEHTTPAKLPTDGVSFIIDPQGLPKELENDMTLKYLRQHTTAAPLMKTMDHFMLDYVVPESISLKRYSMLEKVNPEVFTTLLYCEAADGTQDPILVYKDDPYSKVVIFCCDSRWSNATLSWSYPVLCQNIFQYFFPITFDAVSYDVGSKVTFNARSETLTVKHIETEEETVIETFPSVFKVTKPGTYKTTQKLLNNADGSERKVDEYFYVKLPSSESDLTRTFDELPRPYVESKPKPQDYDLYLYFAIALVALLFAEWLLHSHSN